MKLPQIPKFDKESLSHQVDVVTIPYIIESKAGTLTTDIAKIDISMRVGLFQKAKAKVQLINSNGKPIDVKTVEIEPEQYESWGEGDEYIVNIILEKLNLTKSE